MGGLAPDGVSPLFRVIRGCDRFTWIGGKWNHFDASNNITGYHIGLERVLKHPELADRYLLEMWLAPEMTEREWKENFTKCIDGIFFEELGPYPGSGEYERLKTVETPVTKKFVPLTEAICDALVNTAKLNRDVPAKHKVLAAQERRAKEEAAAKQKRIDMIENMGRPKFTQNPFIIVPGQEKKSTGGIVLS